MTFPIPLQKPRNFPVVVGGGSTPWYLEGGVLLANCLVAYQPKGAASLAVSYSNLANPGTYDATTAAAPDWDDTNGWKFNGSTQYINTNFVPNKIHSIICAFTNGGTTAGRLVFGCETNTAGYPRIFCSPYNATDVCTFVYGNSEISIASRITSGVVAVTPSYPYVNGTKGGAFAAWGALANQTSKLFIGARNAGTDTPSLPKACYVQSFAAYDVTLSDAQVLAISTAMAAL